MDIIKAKDFQNRDDLEKHIIAGYGRTVDKKDAQIEGKVIELDALGVSHGANLWGVPVIASNYEPSDVSRFPRGKRLRSKINGVTQ